MWDAQEAINKDVQRVLGAQNGHSNTVSEYFGVLKDIEFFSSLDQKGARNDGSDPKISISEQTQLTSEIEIETVPLEFVLSNLSVRLGTNFDSSLSLAQGDPSAQVLVVKNGSASLSTLLDKSKELEPKSLITYSGSTYTAHVPLVVLEEAELRLNDNEKLLLNQSTGSFLLNFGAVIAKNAFIASTNEKNPNIPNFRPFVATVLTGYAQFQDVEFSDLGFEDHKNFKGVSFSSTNLFAPANLSFIRSSKFNNVGSIELNGQNKFSFLENLVDGSINNGIEVRASHSVLIAKNVIVNAEKNAIKISESSSRVSLLNNILINSISNGIFVTEGVSQLDIMENLIAKNQSSGVDVQYTACLNINGNLITSNKRNGIAIQDSLIANISDNQIVTNRVGTKVIGRHDTGQFNIHRNHYIGNELGLMGARAHQISLAENDFNFQLPRLFGGEFGQYTNQYLDSVDEGKAAYVFPKTNQSVIIQNTHFPLRAMNSCLQKGID